MAKKEGLAPKRPLGWSQLFKDIRAGKAAGVYLFYGPEEFVKKSAVDQLRAALLPPGLELLNEDVLENVDATAIIESAETLPFLLWGNGGCGKGAMTGGQPEKPAHG